MTYKLVQNQLGEYGVVDEVGDQYPVGTKEAFDAAVKEGK